MNSNYQAIESMIDRVKKEYGKDSKVARMFSECIANTLETTLHEQSDGSVFVITGDIPAMWLRDSACQLRPFLIFAKTEPEIRKLIAGVIKKQIACILIDPYANAFNEAANGNCYRHDKTRMNDFLWERKYEIDSLCYPIQLSYLLWKNTGETGQFDAKWKQAAEIILQVFITEQDHENRSDYRFERENCPFTDTLSREGKGALVKGNIGLTWSGFRPSDDACVYGYLIPSNMLASVALSYMAEIADQIYHDEKLSARAGMLAKEIREAVECYGIVPGEACEFYAYEVDGFGQYLIMDDANLPSLLAMPYFGYCDRNNERYRNTRKIALSDRNPYYYKGTYAKGIGSPHTKAGYVWDIALGIQGMTADTVEEKQEILQMMCNMDAGTGLMHEAIDADCPEHYTRPWFSWANSVFCEFVMDCMGESVQL